PEASTSRASAVRIAAGSESVASQLFAPTARSARMGCESPRSASASCANRAARYVASATSRSPPSAARPASEASAGNRNGVAARAYGGWETITAQSAALRAPGTTPHYILRMAQPAKSVLWVDDEAELLEPHRIFLRDKGFDVELASNADDAVEMVRRRAFNLVLLDEQMPGKRGMDALRELREADPNLAVVMVTKSEEDSTMTEAIGAALDGYLVKPVSPRQVYAAITSLLDGPRLRQQAVARKFVERFR